MVEQREGEECKIGAVRSHGGNAPSTGEGGRVFFLTASTIRIMKLAIHLWRKINSDLSSSTPILEAF